MGKRHAFPHGSLVEAGHQLTYELSRVSAKVQDEEQLKELNKSDPLFFPCVKQEMLEDTISLQYEKEEGYEPLLTWLMRHRRTNKA